MQNISVIMHLQRDNGNFTKDRSYESNWQEVSTGSDNGVVPVLKLSYIH